MEFEKMCQDIAKMGLNLYDLAFYRNGQIQQYRFQPSNRCNNSYSVSKAFLVTAIGLLHDDGMIDVKLPVSCYMGHLMPKDIDPAWQIVTVEDVLTHRVGFDEGFLDIDVEDASAYDTDDYLDIVLRHPIRHVPGTHRQYSDAAFYLVGRLISSITGRRADEFLNERLFQPLKVREVAWSFCPKNYPVGATGLYISSYDMVKLPALYLEGGSWNGKRILSEKWIGKVIANEYEFTSKTPSGLIGKGGMYGQMILFSREKRFAAAWHAYNEDKEAMQTLIDYFDGME